MESFEKESQKLLSILLMTSLVQIRHEAVDCVGGYILAWMKNVANDV